MVIPLCSHYPSNSIYDLKRNSHTVLVIIGKPMQVNRLNLIYCNNTDIISWKISGGAYSSEAINGGMRVGPLLQSYEK